MADKRMVAQQICDSDAFLCMPISTQALYFHLLIRADDDGFVNNPRRICSYIGANEGDLRELISKRFLIGFDSGIVCVKHWKMHNSIPKDRYHPTVYQEELQSLDIRADRAYTERKDTERIQVVDTLSTECIQDDNKTSTEIRLDKIRLDKTNIINLAELEDELADAVMEWFEYKKQQRKPYKELGARKFVTQIKAYESRHGASAVIEQLNLAIASNWQGANLQMLDERKQPVSTPVKTEPIPEDDTDILIKMARRMANAT